VNLWKPWKLKCSSTSLNRRPLVLTWESFNKFPGTARTNQNLFGLTSIWSPWRIRIEIIQPSLSMFEWHIHSYKWSELITSGQKYKNTEFLLKAKCVQRQVIHVASTSERKKSFEFSTTRRNTRWQWTSRLIASVCEEIVAHLEVLSMCRNLMNIATKERWKLLKNWWSIYTASVWIKCQMMHSWMKILRNCVQIVLLKCNFREKLGRVLVLGYDHVFNWFCETAPASLIPFAKSYQSAGLPYLPYF